MEIVHALQPLPDRTVKTLFLAGPTPRDPNVVESWRPKAVSLLSQMRGSDDLTVFYPEYGPDDEYTEAMWVDQCLWEDAALARADVILFWVPRDMETMPGLTTNHEHGEWFRSGKIVFGAPEDAENVRYLEAKAASAGNPTCTDLETALRKALEILGDGAPRAGGETRVPLDVWRTAMFQKWYQAQRAVGNELVDARVEYLFRLKNDRRPFFAVVAVSVSVAAERGRIKSNEFVCMRPDTSAVVLHGPPTADLSDTECVVVKEFRSPGCTRDCFVYEFPGGSIERGESAISSVLHEIAEETGLDVDASRLQIIQARQTASTLLSHSEHLFVVELTPEEIQTVKNLQASNRTLGVAKDTEKTYPMVMTIEQIASSPCDARTLGHVKDAERLMRREKF